MSTIFHLNVDCVNYFDRYENAMPDDITAPLGRAFTATLNRLRGAMREPLSTLPVSLGPPDIGLLQFLLNTPGATPQCLARHQARDKAQLTRKIKALEAQGLIRREADPDDGRKVRLFLSEQGQAMADAAEQIRRAAFAELLQGLNRSEQEQLLGLLQKCQQSLE